MVGLSTTALASLLAASLLPLSQAYSTDDMRSKSVYQVITDRFATDDGSTTKACDVDAASYCGGSYKGLTGKLDYIKGMGFDVIWISPIVSNIGGNTSLGEAYHGYWTLDINKLNDNFGSADDLKNLVSEAKSRDMGIMVDVVSWDARVDSRKRLEHSSPLCFRNASCSPGRQSRCCYYRGGFPAQQRLRSICHTRLLPPTVLLD